MRNRYAAALAAAIVVAVVPASASASGITVTPDTLPPAVQGSYYSQQLGWEADGVTVSPPVTFAITAGKLPPNLTLSSSGLISGWPQWEGTAGFTVTASDTAGHDGKRGYVLAVEPTTFPYSNLVVNMVDSVTYTVTWYVGNVLVCLPYYIDVVLHGWYPYSCHVG